MKIQQTPRLTTFGLTQTRKTAGQTRLAVESRYALLPRHNSNPSHNLTLSLKIIKSINKAFRSKTHIAAPRDGIPTSADDEATDTIPDTVDAAIPDTEADRRYGMHESYDFYDLCQHTERNKGLYTADQRVRRNDQRGTRQNPNGDRRGLECPEER